MNDMFFSAIGEAVLRYATLPTGRRWETPVSDIETMQREAFENRVLPFDCDAERAYADIATMRVSPDARSRDIATRNVRDFEDIADPWVAA